MEKKILFVGLIVLLLFVSCTGDLILDVKNNSSRNIVAFLKERYMATNDTLLPPSVNAGWEKHLNEEHTILPNQQREILAIVDGVNISWRNSWSEKIDTLHLFILDADSLQMYGWKEGIKKGNLFLQRYDLSISNLDDGLIPFPIPYPPTPEMGRNAKMWPPYNFDE